MYKLFRKAKDLEYLNNFQKGTKLDDLYYLYQELLQRYRIQDNMVLF